MFAGTVQLYYWPDATTSDENTAERALMVSTYVDESGYTFVSPSVYVAFTSLWAEDHCGTVGNVLTSTTMAFDLSEVSTFGDDKRSTSCTGNTELQYIFSKSFPGYMNLWTVPQPLTLADLGQNCSALRGIYYDPNDRYNYLYNSKSTSCILKVRKKVLTSHRSMPPIVSLLAAILVHPEEVP